jgi:PKD repeat protein
VSCGTDNASLTVTFSDAGSNDTHSAEVDWNNDGTYEQTVDPFASAGTISHTYATAGSHTAKVRVTDDDLGVSNVMSASLLVKYNLSSILQPINDTGHGQSPSVFKYGSTVPVKVEITNCDGSHPSNLDVRVFAVKASSVPPGTGEEETATANQADAGNQMRFSDPIYIFNWSTKSIDDSSSTVLLTVKIVATGQTKTATIGLKAK